ncbi:Uncharacterised protein [Mycobacteroides abscessus subsp. abscessus]|nr:Uncharacterised protein [Mycobacteroides abscessus subsp. abscessus]
MGGTTDIHRVSRRGVCGSVLCSMAFRLAMLPKAQPSAPSSVRTTGTSAAEAPCVARSVAMSAIPATASVIPVTCTADIRSPSSTTPRIAVNGAEACRTRDARPVGMPLAMARNRNANWMVPNPSP